MSNNFSIPYSIVTLILVSTSVFYPIVVWVDSIIHGINGNGGLYIDLLNYTYDSNAKIYVFNFKISNDYVEFIHLIDILINGLSFKGLGDNAYYSQCSQFEYNLGVIVDKCCASKFSITMLGKYTIYLKLYIPRDVFNGDNIVFLFNFMKGCNSNVLSVKVFVNK